MDAEYINIIQQQEEAINIYRVPQNYHPFNNRFSVQFGYDVFSAKITWHQFFQLIERLKKKGFS